MAGQDVFRLVGYVDRVEKGHDHYDDERGR